MTFEIKGPRTIADTGGRQSLRKSTSPHVQRAAAMAMLRLQFFFSEGTM